jgi:hypothetical protein
LIVGIVVKLKAARSRNPGDKKTAQAGVHLPTHLMRRAGNIGTIPEAATIFSRGWTSVVDWLRASPFA